MSTRGGGKCLPNRPNIMVDGLRDHHHILMSVPHSLSPTLPQVLVEPGFGEDVRLQPPSSPPTLPPSTPSPPPSKHPSYVEPLTRSPLKKSTRTRHSSEPPQGGGAVVTLATIILYTTSN